MISCRFKIWITIINYLIIIYIVLWVWDHINEALKTNIMELNLLFKQNLNSLEETKDYFLILLKFILFPRNSQDFLND